MNTEVTNLITPRSAREVGSDASSEYKSVDSEESKKRRKKRSSTKSVYSRRELKEDLVKAYTWPDFTEAFAQEIPAPNLNRDSADNFAKNFRKVNDDEFEYKEEGSSCFNL